MLSVLLASLSSDAATNKVLLVRHSGRQCERMECLTEEEGYCLQYQKDFYLYARGCPAETHTCSKCQYGSEGNDTEATVCQCEANWRQQSVGYNDRCDAARICSVGECYRPCETYLQSTTCPFPRCRWDTQAAIPVCTRVQPEATGRRLEDFPLSLDGFKNSTAFLHFNGVLASLAMPSEEAFSRLDRNNDRRITAEEFMNGLDEWLETVHHRTQEFQAGRRKQIFEAHKRQLQESTNSNATDETQPAVRISAAYCAQQNKRYCSFNRACVPDCTLCGWYTATDMDSFSCVPPNTKSCLQEGKIYCTSDDSCHPFGDCKQCYGRPIADYSQNQCLAPWWYDASPDVDTWVCRYRNKNGRKCNHDQDCLHGLKRCIDGKCAPMRTKQTVQGNTESPNSADTCVIDVDCPHLGYYCPTSDDPNYIRICQPQKKIGDKCATNTGTTECVPEARCNTREIPHKCRRLFSLDLGYPSSDPLICTFGVIDAEGKCVVGAQSKSVSQSCHDHTDCPTTIPGVYGECRCKAWWNSEDSRYCLPVMGDYKNHNENLRNYLWFVATNCGSFWTEDECLDEFEEAKRLKLHVDCETQQLSGGPFLPQAACGLQDGTELPARKWVAMQDRPIWVDYCLDLEIIGAV